MSNSKQAALSVAHLWDMTDSVRYVLENENVPWEKQQEAIIDAAAAYNKHYNSTQLCPGYADYLALAKASLSALYALMPATAESGKAREQADKALRYKAIETAGLAYRPAYRAIACE